MTMTRDSLVLLDKGYTPLADVKVGDVCLTPLGPTQVVEARLVHVLPNARTEITSGCTFIFARRLFGKTGFHTVWNVKRVEMMRRFGMTINIRFAEDQPQPTPDEIYTFGLPVLLNAPIAPEPNEVEAWGLITDNGIAVVGDVIVGCKRRPLDAESYPVGGTHITTQQLEQFKNANF